MTTDQRALIEVMIRKRGEGLTFQGSAEIAALTAALGTCENCEHGNDAETPLHGLTHCTLAGSHYNGKLMTLQSRCEDWQERQDRFSAVEGATA